MQKRSHSSPIALTAYVLLTSLSQSANGEGMDYMMASESVSLCQFGYKRSDIQDILPGQAVIIPKASPPVIAQVQPRKAYIPDIVEYCYFAWLDSIIDNISPSISRNMGPKLGDRMIKVLTPALNEIHVVMPIPETSNTSAPCVLESVREAVAKGSAGQEEI